MLFSLWALSFSTAVACGPFFPHTLLGSGAKAIFSGPFADFRHELEAFIPAVPVGLVGNAVDRSTAEMIDARRELGPDHPALAGLQQFRVELEAARRGQADVPVVPAGLPGPWDLYLQGVRHLELGQEAEALAVFRSVAALPADVAGSRGLWALRNVAVLDRDEEALQTALARVHRGQPDTLGVTASAWGWKGLWDWQSGRSDAAIHAYLVQHASGDPTALRSLRWLLPQVLTDPTLRDRALADERSANVMLAWMASGGGTQAQRTAWLADLPVDRGAPGLRAWVAWLARDMAQLDAALRVAPPSDVITWLKARKAMLDGDLEGALHWLEETSFSEADAWTCAWYSRGGWDARPTIHPGRETASERGALLLRTGDGVGALRAFAAAGYWFDTAHVAERVVDADTLRAQIDADLTKIVCYQFS